MLGWYSRVHKSAVIEVPFGCKSNADAFIMLFEKSINIIKNILL